MLIVGMNVRQAVVESVDDGRPCENTVKHILFVFMRQLERLYDTMRFIFNLIQVSYTY